MKPFYRSLSFWTMIAAVAVQVVVGIGYQAEAEAIGGVTAVIIAYLAKRGYVEKAVVQGQQHYDMGFADGREVGVGEGFSTATAAFAATKKAKK